ncbi:cytochrome P450 [Enterovirga rhinocerotis]|uniref:Cytochrome P450 n=1 Tax=Enterovirga rhinocerotis TaxID=1339210 RepID=A0A4R7BV83_9HYPH|nr:cytochrome P450 [Enterovirga rhinocerotis]TDR88107.1 cytochrome P450 [Enterovirga rhinocerotis]
MLAEPKDRFRPDRFRPPAPTPLRRPPDIFAFLKGARDNPLTTWTQAHFEEPVIASEGVLGRVTVLSDPQAIRHVLVDNSANYRKDDLQRRVLAPGLGEGLLTAEGPVWRRQRRALAPLFTPKTVASFRAPMVEAADRLVRRLTRRDGRPVDAVLEMTRVTLDVLERTIFTHGLARDPDALSRAITRYFEAIGPIDPLDVFGLPGWVPRIGRIRARPALRFFEEVVGELTDARKRLLAAGEAAPRDLLTLLLEAEDPETGERLSDLEVSANVVTFIGAGHETTANALSWALYLLSQAPLVRDRLEAEIDAAGPTCAPDDLPFTRAVLEEAMRLYPPVPFMSRSAIAEDRVLGYRIPKGSLVMIAPWVLHRHRTLWDEPDAFDPERFMPERRTRIDRFAYLPFGAGPRVCIGAAFSLQEQVIVLARIAAAARLDLEPGTRVMPVHRVTLRPSDGLPMRVRLR